MAGEAFQPALILHAQKILHQPAPAHIVAAHQLVFGEALGQCPGKTISGNIEVHTVFRFAGLQVLAFQHVSVPQQEIAAIRAFFQHAHVF